MVGRIKRATRLDLMVEPSLKEALQREAVRLSVMEGRPVSVAEAARRILSKALAENPSSGSR